MDYNALADFSVNYGLAFFCGLLFIGLIFVIFAYTFWILCLIDAFKRSPEKFPDRTLWISILLISFFLPGVIWQVIASIVYYAMYRPNLRVWENSN